MEILIRVSRYPLKRFLHIFKGGQKNEIHKTTWVLYCSNSNKNHIDSNKDLIFQKHQFFKEEESEYKQALLDELLDECGIEKFDLPVAGAAKEYIATVDLDLLQKLGILPVGKNLTQSLLSCLEPFPFDPSYSFDRRRSTTIKTIRDNIEIEYLAWKFDIDRKVMSRLFQCFKTSLFVGRSLRSMKRNLEIINSQPKVKNENVASKMYLLSLKPFNKISVKSYKNNFAGVSWDIVAQSNPALIRKPYSTIMWLLDVLKENNLTDQQIQQGLHTLKGSPMRIITKLNYLINNPEFSQYKDSERFLMLLRLPILALQNPKYCSNSDIQSLLSDNHTVEKKFRLSDMHFCLQMLINRRINFNNFKNLQRHPKLSMASISEIRDTVKYLKTCFSEEEIMESLSVVLYPRKLVHNSLEKILKYEKNLNKIGLINCITNQNTCDFSKGTKLPNKKLQLCLYYMEKPYDFTGSGIYDLYS